MGVAVAVAAGCGGSPAPLQVKRDPPVVVGESGVIRQDAFGSGWPFTVKWGVLKCHGTSAVGQATFTGPGGATYWLNSAAEKHAKEHRWKAPHRIWRKNPAAAT